MWPARSCDSRYFGCRSVIGRAVRDERIHSSSSAFDEDGVLLLCLSSSAEGGPKRDTHHVGIVVVAGQAGIAKCELGRSERKLRCVSRGTQLARLDHVFVAKVLNLPANLA
jgi:hypothetical protein